MSFPEKIYTINEVKIAQDLISKGHKHKLVIKGSDEFKIKVNQAIEHIKTADCYDFLITYIKKISEIDGLTQLRETEVSIWANKFAVENTVDAASLFIQKAYSMKEYLEGQLYYGGNAEKRSVNKRIEFLKTLKDKTSDVAIKEECNRQLSLWSEGSLSF